MFTVVLQIHCCVEMAVIPLVVAHNPDEGKAALPGCKRQHHSHRQLVIPLLRVYYPHMNHDIAVFSLPGDAHLT